MNEAIALAQTQDTLRQECEQTLAERARRYLQAKPHGVIPLTHFAPVSAEATLLFRDGHFYACIALAQAVAEALVRFLCEKNSCSPRKDFDKNVEKLTTRGFITEEIKGKLLQIWDARHDYHHLNADIETDKERLQEMAIEKLNLLTDVEKEIFAFTIVEGKLVPTNRKYWDIDGEFAKVYIRLSP